MRERRAAAGLAEVEGLGEVEVEGLPRGNAEVEAVTGDGFTDGLRVLAEHRAAARQYRVAGGRRRPRCIAQQTGGRPDVLHSGGGARKEGGGEELQFALVVCLQDRATQTGGTILLAPATGRGVVFAVEREALHGEL